MIEGWSASVLNVLKTLESTSGKDIEPVDIERVKQDIETCIREFFDTNLKDKVSQRIKINASIIQIQWTHCHGTRRWR